MRVMVFFFLGLLATISVCKAHSQQEMDSDDIALKIFYNAVIQEKIANPELVLAKVVDQFPLKRAITSFDISYVENTPLLEDKPSVDISDNEWQALLNSNITTYTEMGTVRFSLVDLDNNGQRDLIIDSYVGGTGLFSYTGILKRGDTAFYSTNDDANKDDFETPGVLFSENGRGANQWSQWIEINDQLYAVWFNGNFGEDNLYLIRPFSQTDNIAAVTIRYYYDLDLIESDNDLNDNDRNSLLESLSRMQENLLGKKNTERDNTSICPIPVGTLPEDIERYSMGMAHHYTYEVVANIPIWLDGHCYIGSITSHFGYYNDGIEAEIVFWSPENDTGISGSYAMTGLRKVISVTSSYKKREGDNGY